MSNENGNGNHRNGANNNGHQRNGQVNGSVNGHQDGSANHHVPANGVAKNGNGNGHHSADSIPAHVLLWDSLPASVTEKLAHPWTPAWSPSARAGATGASATSRAAPSSTRPTASSDSAAGAMSWLAT